MPIVTARRSLTRESSPQSLTAATIQKRRESAAALKANARAAAFRLESIPSNPNDPGRGLQPMSTGDSMQQRAEQFVARYGAVREEIGARHRRPRRHRPRRADLPVRRRPLPAGRRARAGQDAPGTHAGQDPGPGLLAHPVHARPDAGRHHGHEHGDGVARRQAILRVSTRADLHADLPGRRNQPGHAQDAVGHARSDAGGLGQRRRHRSFSSSSRSS